MSVATHPPRATRLRRLAIVGGVALAAVAAADRHLVLGRLVARARARPGRHRRGAHQRALLRPGRAGRRAR